MNEWKAYMTKKNDHFLKFFFLKHPFSDSTPENKAIYIEVYKYFNCINCIRETTHMY